MSSIVLHQTQIDHGCVCECVFLHVSACTCNTFSTHAHARGYAILSIYNAINWILVCLSSGSRVFSKSWFFCFVDESCLIFFFDRYLFYPCRFLRIWTRHMQPFFLHFGMRSLKACVRKIILVTGKSEKMPLSIRNRFFIHCYAWLSF